MFNRCAICQSDIPPDPLLSVGLVGGNKICFACCESIERETEPDESEELSVSNLNQARGRQKDILAQIAEEGRPWDKDILRKRLKESVFLEHQMICTSRWSKIQKRIASGQWIA